MQEYHVRIALMMFGFVMGVTYTMFFIVR